MSVTRAPVRLSLLIAVMLSAVLAPVTSAAEETPNNACLYPSAHQRFAFSVGGTENGGINAFNVAPLHGGAYLDWWANADAPHPGGIDYLPMIYVNEFLPDWQPEGYVPNGAYLQLAIRNNPGATWLIGNEAEYRGDHDLATPEGYARIYHDIYHTIKSADPTAKVAMNGFATVSPLRLAWLDRAWQAYRSMYEVDMPVDVWNFHGYVVNEMVHEWGPDLPYGFVNAVGYGAGEWTEVDDFGRQRRHVSQKPQLGRAFLLCLRGRRSDGLLVHRAGRRPGRHLHRRPFGANHRPVYAISRPAQPDFRQFAAITASCPGTAPPHPCRSGRAEERGCQRQLGAG